MPEASGAAGEATIHSYTSTNLGSLGGHATEAEAINDAGHVAGTSRNSNGYYRAFRWENGVMLDLGSLPERTHSGATAINNQGQVVGRTHADPADYRAFL